MKKLLLLLISLLFAITPACKQTRSGRGAVITGGVLTGLGIASSIAILPVVWCLPELLALPAGFFGLGTPLLIIGKEDMATARAENLRAEVSLDQQQKK